MARIVSFSVFRGAAYATTRNYFSEEGRAKDQPASELPESEPPIKKRRKPSHVALSGFVPSARIGEPITNKGYSTKVTAFEGGAEL